MVIMVNPSSSRVNTVFLSQSVDLSLSFSHGLKINPTNYQAEQALRSFTSNVKTSPHSIETLCSKSKSHTKILASKSIKTLASKYT